ncbi:hypothetical protein XF30_00055 [Bradyrhizobium sp. SUTN9-2]|nr:hypothetical protein XF30_00055 [Bradyrhizobium sp. SUTN9-2]
MSRVAVPLLENLRRHFQRLEHIFADRRRWVVERTFAWLGRCRHLCKDFEGSAATELAWLLVAQLRLLTRRLAGLERSMLFE